ncbi:single-stranded DNA-binding protein [Paracidovorax citrulli]|uniref:single-stranded DNA-binding protein n=1 Tax=Paracidovorax citrulli TaxID=80869 RepID=UPI003FA72787
MGFSLNRQLIIGNLGRDPELTDKPDFRYATLSIATEETWKDKFSGEWKSFTTWHRVILRGADIDWALRNLCKGDSVYVEGVTRHRSWKTADGQQRTITEVNADVLRLHSKAAPRSATAGEAEGVRSEPHVRPAQAEDAQGQGHAGSDPCGGEDDPTQFRF